MKVSIKFLKNAEKSKNTENNDDEKNENSDDKEAESVEDTNTEKKDSEIKGNGELILNESCIEINNKLLLLFIPYGKKKTAMIKKQMVKMK